MGNDITMVDTILFKRDNNGYTVDPLIPKIREAATKERWTGMAGFKQWAKENYNATLRAGRYDDWTSIAFKNEQDFDKFKEHFGVEE
jgi:hypothetical protein